MARHPDPRKHFAPHILPWLSAVIVFALYATTINHWVSLYNLSAVSKVSGWWLPEIVNPLLYLATYPFRWLPEADVPMALNLFAAVCAAATLGLLARSVAILPQDRTDAQRKREHSDFSFLTIRSAWLPPLLAVLVCGLQMTFWENATNETGEMFELLLFAFIVWSLLEYRLDERESRLFLAAFVYGASMAETWAMTGFLPLFFAALIWIRGMGFFNWHFLKRFLGWGCVGLLFFLLLPLIATVSGDGSLTFWQALKWNLAPQFEIVRAVFFTMLRPVQSAEVLAVALAYFFPLLILSIRWKPSFGDSSNVGAELTTFIFHIVHAAFLGLLTWIAFDPAFGPRRHGTGSSMLTFYYLGALSIGYFCGYLLLIFGEKELAKRPKRPSPFAFLNPILFTCVWIFAAVAIAGLFYRNLPAIQAKNSDTLWRCADLLTEKLPASGGYLLSDDVQHLALAEAALARKGRANNFVPLETPSLVLPAYHHYLHKKYPSTWPDFVGANTTNTINLVALIQRLGMLARTNDFYYLHPSFGYYFEAFYPESHGMTYKLKLLPEDTLLPPKADQKLIAENETFWSQDAAPALAELDRRLAPPAPNALTIGDKLLQKFHIDAEHDPNVIVIGTFYSRALDFWGVELERAGELPKAAARFEQATNLNSDNAVAVVNAAFNARLAAGEHITVDLSQATMDQFRSFGTWNDLFNFNGPFDEPSFRYRLGQLLTHDNGLFRQSIAQFDRVRELAPDFLPAYYELAQACLLTRLPDRALEALRTPMDHPERFGLNETNETQLHMLVAGAYFQKNENDRAVKLLRSEIERHSDDIQLLAAVSQVFIARSRFDDALDAVDRELKIIPDEPSALNNRGYVLVQLKRYDEAITALDRVLAAQPDNHDALFNRALAHLYRGDLDAAHADYETLQQSVPNSPAIAYGLGEIAYRRHDTNEAVRNYQIYLANANTNSDEAKTVAARLQELKK